MSRRKSTNDRITIDALQFYVPIFHKGDEAISLLSESGKEISFVEKNKLENVAALREMALMKIASLSGPLITQEISKIIKGSKIRERHDEVFDVLYYAGIDGLRKGLRKFNVDKINVSSTNYLFQWITTYAKNELDALEAPFGVPPSRYRKYKKISAVRNKLSDQLGRSVSNEEILDYFLTGKADIRHMNGPKNKPVRYASNQSITLALIEEQEEFESTFHYVELVDPLNDYSIEATKFHTDEKIFSETLFGSFAYYCGLNDAATAVLMSELEVNNIPHYLEEVVVSMTTTQYKKISEALKQVMRDSDGPFYRFLLKNRDNFDDFDIDKTIKAIEGSSLTAQKKAYQMVFNER